MIPLSDQAIRFLISKMHAGVWIKGTGFVAYEVVTDAIHRGLVEPRGDGDDRTVRLTTHGIEMQLMMGPDGTASVRELQNVG